MDKYAQVYFGPTEAKEQRDFLNAMNGLGIIEISKDRIDDEIRLFEEEKTGMTNRLVLHGNEEVKHFEIMMATFFSGREYKITDDPDDPVFDNWIKEQAGRITL